MRCDLRGAPGAKDTIAILGLGGVGMNGLQTAPHLGVPAERILVVDTAFDFASHEQTMTTAQMVLRNGGTIVFVGLMSLTVPLLPLVAVVKALTIKTSYNGAMDAFWECLEPMSQGVLKPRVETGSIMFLPSVLKDLNEGRFQNRMVLLPDWTS